MSKQAKTSGKSNFKALKSLPHITRSSAAEYLTFVAAAGQGGVEALYADENVWLTQKMMAQLYDVNVRTINEHLQKVFADRELHKDSVIRKVRITATGSCRTGCISRTLIGCWKARAAVRKGGHDAA